MKRRLLIASVFLLPACSYLGEVGEWFNDSPIVAELVVRQATARFIEADSNPAERAQEVISVTDTARAYINADSSATVDSLLAVIDQQINWDELDTADRLLLQDLVTIVQQQLISEQDAGRVPDDQLVGLDAMLNTIQATAAVYVAS